MERASRGRTWPTGPGVALGGGEFNGTERHALEFELGNTSENSAGGVS